MLNKEQIFREVKEIILDCEKRIEATDYDGQEDSYADILAIEANGYEKIKVCFKGWIKEDSKNDEG